MQPNNNLSCIPFYRSLEEQDFRKWYAFGEKYPYRMPSDFLIPFYIISPPTPSGEAWGVDEVAFYRVCCEETPITNNGSFNFSFNESFRQGDPYRTIMGSNGLVIKEINNQFNEIVYYAKHNTPLNLDKGFYYMSITIGCAGEEDVTYYSDVFYVDTRESLEANSVHLEWWNEDNVEYDGGFIPYGLEESGSLFKSEVFLDTEIGKPNYISIEEGEERNGFFFPTKQISEKTYNMGFLAPEYMCDVMRLVRMADSVRVTDKLGRVYNVEQFEMDVDWTSQGHYAEVSCTFHTDTIVKKVGKAYTSMTNR